MLLAGLLNGAIVAFPNIPREFLSISLNDHGKELS
jgi:hypothetical protein